jgi:hypothetical protein
MRLHALAALTSTYFPISQVITYNGVVTISSQEQAKQFGSKLYRHLSKGNKVVVTPELIHKLFDERKELVRSDENEKVQHEVELANIASAQASNAMFEDEREHDVSDSISTFCNLLLQNLRSFQCCACISDTMGCSFAGREGSTVERGGGAV